MSKKVAIVTGASRGIGEASARKLAIAGFTVVVNDVIDKDKIDKIASDINGVAIKADVTDEVQVITMVDEVIDKFGRIDVLVNNAGIRNQPYELETTTKECWQQTFDVNVWGTFCCSRVCARHMLKQKSGKIINMSSIRSTGGTTTAVAYAATKSAVDSITCTLSRAYAPYINVNGVAPGATDIGMLHQIGEDRYNMLKDEAPFKRLANPDEIADAVVFLASDKASYITGQTLIVDGGQLLG